MDTLHEYKRTVSFIQTTIPAGSQVSPQIDMGGMQLRGIIFPTNWTSSSVRFKASMVESSTAGYQTYDIYNFDGTTTAILSLHFSVATGGWVPLVPYWTDAVPYITLFSSVAQASDTTLFLAVQPVYQGLHG